MISFACPKCQNKLQGKEDFAGKQAKCPKCLHLFVVPVLAASPPPVPEVKSQTLRLDLLIRDHEVVGELRKYADGEPRNDFALAALKIGILALRQASGIIDSQVLRHEGEQLVAGIREAVSAKATHFHDVFSGTLKKYFDPNDGDLRHRLDRLLKKDGELQNLLALHLDGSESTIARTLAKHVGEQSPLFRLLSPNQSDGILAALTDAIQQALLNQRDHILRQFSLDDKESALSRLTLELRGANGQLRADFSDDVIKLTKEFSLDNQEGALCRLVARVDKAQQSIADQFSQDNEDSALNHLSRLIETANDSIQSSLTLDDEKSPLYRLRRELLKVIEDMEKGNSDFQKEVLTTLESFKARREEMVRSTRHGGEFEDAVGSFLQDDAQKRGDLFESTGNRAGSKQYCKVGDHVLTLGDDSAAPGVRVVCEAKEDKSYDLAKAQAEIQEARQNRNAQIGIFVFSKATAPAGLDPFARHGSDLFVVWDGEDPTTDIFLKVAMSVARALVIREKLADDRQKVGVNKVKQTLIALTKDIESLEEITKWAGTIQNNSKKILNSVEKIQSNLEEQVAALKEHLDDLEQEEASAVRPV